MPLVTHGATGAQAYVEKRLSTRERESREAIEALSREALLLEALAGAGAPRLLDRGEDGAGPFLRMERIAAPTLHEVIARAEPAFAIASRVALAFDALAAVHAAADARGPLEIVHADLSPANVCVDEARVVLLDFGLARFRESPPHDGTFRGTVGYVAPEVARGEVPAPPADVFALACSLAHALLAEPPRTPTALAVALVVAAEEPVAPALTARLAEIVPGPIAEALLSALAHEPGARPSAAEIAARARARGTGMW